MKTPSITLLSILLLLASCSATGPVFKQAPSNENAATVYFYREYAFAGSVFSVDVSVDGKDVISLSNESYFPYQAKPGVLDIKAKGGIMERRLSLKVEPGKHYFVRTGGVAHETNFILWIMKPEAGRVEINNNRLQHPGDTSNS